MTDTMTIEEYRHYQQTGKLPKRFEKQTRSSVLATVAEAAPDLLDQAVNAGKKQPMVLNPAPALTIKERQFQELVIQAAKRTGWACYHTHDSRRSEPGYPDLHLVHGVRGESLFAELKTEKGTLSDAQKHWLAMLTAAGQRVYLWRPSDWQHIERILTGASA